MEYLYIKYTKKKMLNLYNILMENYSVEQLINEGKDPVEVLHYKYQHVPSSIIDGIINIDPTKKKSYSQWVLSKWDNESNIIKTALENGRLEKLFQHFKMHNDIQLQSFPSVEKCLNEFIPNEDTVLTKSKEPETYLLALDKYVPSEEANDFDIVFNEDNWLIAVPNTYYAECKLGENMRWCTANAFGNGERYYNDYLSQGGKYYVNFNMNEPESVHGKDYPYTRYQFHFESNQFMDSDDQPIESLSDIDIPQSAIDFYTDLGYDTDDLEGYEVRYERYEQERWEYSVRINDDLALMVEFNDDLNFEAPDNYTEYYLFNITNDTRDPISWNTFYINRETFVDSSDDGGESWNILKTTNGACTFVCTSDRNSCEYEMIDDIINYLKINDNTFVFLRDDRGTILTYYYYSEIIESETYLHGINDIEINKECTLLSNNKYIFIELSDKDEHSLYRIDNENIECIIKSDIPLKSSDFIHFIPDKNGNIVTDFKTYNIFYDKTNVNNDNINYQWYDVLDNGYYLVSYEFDNGKEKLNVVNPNTKKPLFNFWFSKLCFDNSKNGVIGFSAYNLEGENGVRFYIATLDGKFVSNGYNTNVGMVDTDLFIAAGISSTHVDLIDLNKDEIFATFKEMFLHLRTKDGIIHVKIEDNIDAFYNYKNRQYEIGQYKNLHSLYDIFSSNVPYFYGLNINTNNIELFNPYTQHICLKGIDAVNYTMLDYDLKLVKVDLQNETCNLFKLDEEKLLLDNNIIKILNVSSSHLCSVLTNDNKIKVFDTKDEKYIVNSNGWYLDKDVESVQVSSYGLVFILPENTPIAKLYYNTNLQQFISYTKNDYANSMRIDANAPKEVFQWINHLEGRDMQIMNEKFNNIFKKITYKI